MGSEMNRNRSGTNWLLGVTLIGLGGIFLFDQLLPGFIGGLLWAAAFAVGGLAVYGWSRQNPRQRWALIPAYMAEVIAGVILLSTLRFVPGELTGAFIMFAIIYYWTPPHFWALALIRQKEYRAAGVPMLPVVAGVRGTHRQLVLYSVLLFIIALVPVFLGLLGPVYLALAAFRASNCRSKAGTSSCTMLQSVSSSRPRYP